MSYYGDDDGAGKPSEYHGKAHHHITKAMYPAGSVARWMTTRSWGEVMPDTVLLALSSIVNDVEDNIKQAKEYYALEEKKKKKKITDEEKKRMEEISDLPTPEITLAKFMNEFIHHKENVAPSVDGLRSDQGFKILVSGGGSVVQKKKRGIWGRIRGRKEESEMVPVVRGEQ